MQMTGHSTQFLPAENHLFFAQGSPELQDAIPGHHQPQSQRLTHHCQTVHTRAIRVQLLLRLLGHISVWAPWKRPKERYR